LRARLKAVLPESERGQAKDKRAKPKDIAEAQRTQRGAEKRVRLDCF